MQHCGRRLWLLAIEQRRDPDVLVPEPELLLARLRLRRSRLDLHGRYGSDLQ
jgi:hypothetical protein